MPKAGYEPGIVEVIMFVNIVVQQIFLEEKIKITKFSIHKKSTQTKRKDFQRPIDSVKLIQLMIRKSPMPHYWLW